MRRTLVVALAIAALAGCSSTGQSGTATVPSASPTSSTTPSPAATAPTPAPATSPSAEHNRLAAVTWTHHLLTVMALPPGSTRLATGPKKDLTGPPLGMSATSNFLDATAFWRVPLSFSAFTTWVQTHVPAGFQVGGSSSGSDYDGAPVNVGIELDAPIDPQAPLNKPGELEVSAITAGSSSIASIWRIDGTDIWYDPTPVRDGSKGPFLHVTIGSGCPASRGDAVDVSNAFASRTQTLLPAGEPSAALVCEFAGMNPPPVGRVASHHVLSADQASALARQARALRTGSEGVTEISCPMDQGESTVIAFAYPQGDIDLWWHVDGCGSVDNGSIVAFMGSLTLPS